MLYLHFSGFSHFLGAREGQGFLRRGKEGQQGQQVSPMVSHLFGGQGRGKEFILGAKKLTADKVRAW